MNIVNELKKLAAASVYRANLYIKRNPLIEKLINVTGSRSLLYGMRERVIENMDDIHYETDINGTRVKMVDSTKTHKYYKESIRGDIHEPPITRMLKNLLLEFESPTFVDIGAHIGYYTAYAGNILRDTGKVIAIEPNISFFEMLNKNIEVNGISEITQAYNLALSSDKGKATMGGWEDRTFIETDEGSIEVTSFDELCLNENIKPDIVKIDVHGAEVKVLQGMGTVLKNNIQHLFVETHSSSLMQGFNAKDLFNLFERSHFEVFEVANFRRAYGGELVPIKEDIFKDHNDRMLYIKRA